jgi:sRNA-binding carbon storage regulator CsrA
MPSAYLSSATPRCRSVSLTRVEVRIGVQNAPREIAIESAESADAVQKSVEKALKDGTSLVLADEKGRRVVIAAGKLAYVDIAESDARRVGFGAL